MLLLTLLVNDEHDDAAKTASEDPAYRLPATAMSIASVAVSAIKTLSEIFELEPTEVMKAISLGAAQMIVDLEKKDDS